MKSAIISLLVEPPAVVLTLALWYTLVSIALRAFRIRLPIGIWRYSFVDPEDQLSRFNFIVVQSLLWGGWFYLIGVVPEFIRTKFGISVPYHGPGESLFRASSDLVLGVWFGWLMWKNFRANPYERFDRLSINPNTRS